MKLYVLISKFLVIGPGAWAKRRTCSSRAGGWDGGQCQYKVPPFFLWGFDRNTIYDVLSMLCSQNFYPVFAWIFLTDFNQAVLHGKASGDSGEVWGERKRRWAYQTGPSKKFFNDKLKELNIEKLWYLRNCQKVSAIVKKNNRLSQVAEVFLHLHQQHRTTWTQVLRHSCVKGGVAQSISCSTKKAKKIARIANVV